MWNKDDVGRDKHSIEKREEGKRDHTRARELNRQLQGMGYVTWFHQDRLHGHLLDTLTKGIEESALILLCVTQSYVSFVNYTCFRC